MYDCVSTDNVSLTKNLCHRNFGNEFMFTQRKDYLSRNFATELSLHEHTFFDKPILCKIKSVRGNAAYFTVAIIMIMAHSTNACIIV